MNLTNEMRQKIADANRANPYADITPFVIGVGMPIIHYSGFFPKADECVIYVVAAQTFTDKSRVVGYTGKSAGASFRVAKGVTVRTGGSGGKAIRKNIRDYNSGDLIITNKRVVFIGKDDSFEYSINRLSAVKALDNHSFVLQSGKSSKNISMDPAVISYAIGFISYVQKETSVGEDLYKKLQISLTQEQLAYCENVRKECANIYAPKKQEKAGCLVWCFKIFVLFMVVCFVMAIVMAVTGYEPGKQEQTESKITSYTAAELVNLEKHPRIYDSYEEAQAFYEQVGDSRVVVTDIATKSKTERELKSTYDDNIVLYLTRLSDDNFIGSVEINIFDEDFAANMTLNNAVDIAVSYLPLDFFEYYASDASYIYESNNARLYTYSVRLTDEGVEYHNSVAPQYSYYYYIEIYEYADGNHWKIETGSSAYGGKELDWIENYTEPWDAPFEMFENE